MLVGQLSWIWRNRRDLPRLPDYLGAVRADRTRWRIPRRSTVFSRGKPSQLADYLTQVKINLVQDDFTQELFALNEELQR